MRVRTGDTKSFKEESNETLHTERCLLARVSGKQADFRPHHKRLLRTSSTLSCWERTKRNTDKTRTLLLI